MGVFGGDVSGPASSISTFIPKYNPMLVGVSPPRHGLKRDRRGRAGGGDSNRLHTPEQSATGM